MKKSYAHILIIGFCVFLAFPTLLALSGAKGLKTMEAQQTIWPEMTEKGSLKNYLKAAKEYFKTNFTGRNELIYLHSSLYYKWLHESPIPNQIVLGKDNWLFLGDYYSDVLKQHYNLAPLTNTATKKIVGHLLAINQKMVARGIKFYVLIAPNSHSIYADKLPARVVLNVPGNAENILSGQPQTPHDVLTNSLEKYPQLAYVDIRDTLLRAKQIMPVYQKTDSHWNLNGALVACGALIHKIRADFPYVPLPSKDDYWYEKLPAIGGDLADLMMLREQISEPNYIGIKLKDTTKTARLKTSVWLGAGRYDTHWTGSDKKQPTLLVIGDSFIDKMSSFLPAYFGKSYFVHQATIDWRQIDSEKPDVVVVEIVERNLPALEHL